MNEPGAVCVSRLPIERAVIRWSFVVEVSENRFVHQLRGMPARTLIAALVLAGLVHVLAAQTPDDWQTRVRADVETHRIDAALAVVDQRVADAPEDWEAHGWRGRLLAWKGRWPDGEAEYRLVLANVPDDTEMLTGLSDVLLWQKKYTEALQTLDEATKLSPSEPEILSRRARVLALLGRAHEARSEYEKTLRFDAQNSDARAGLDSLSESAKHELRIGEDADVFSYTNAGQTQGVSLSSRWNQRWSAAFGINTYQRFDQNAVKFLASTSFHFTASDWLSAGTAVANGQSVVPTNEAFFEYGHAFRIENRWVQGLESSYQQHWFWYQGAHVLTLNTSQIIYLPREWTWSLNMTGARTGFAGTPVDWTPSGWTKLGFPLQRRLTGNVFFGVGSENFAQIDQIGRFSGHTFGGGLRYRFAASQDITGYVARQDRTHGQIDTSLGLSYGIRF
jgi:tetratricopeptide (TPR) repeat protein